MQCWTCIVWEDVVTIEPLWWGLGFIYIFRTIRLLDIIVGEWWSSGTGASLEPGRPRSKSLPYPDILCDAEQDPEAAYRCGKNQNQTVLYFKLGAPLHWAQGMPRRGVVLVLPSLSNICIDCALEPAIR